MDETIKNYKELLINKSSKTHIYFFKTNHDVQSYNIKGYYAIDDFDNKWLSVCAISNILPEHYYEKFNSKYFDINNSDQKLFYSTQQSINLSFIKNKLFGKNLIGIIKSNTRQGSPRKFLQTSNGEKVNIELPFETINNFKFD